MPTTDPAVATATVGRFTATVTLEADRFGYHDVTTFADGDQFGDVCATPIRGFDDPVELALAAATLALETARGLHDARQ